MPLAAFVKICTLDVRIGTLIGKSAIDISVPSARVCWQHKVAGDIHRASAVIMVAVRRARNFMVVYWHFGFGVCMCVAATRSPSCHCFPGTHKERFFFQ